MNTTADLMRVVLNNTHTVVFTNLGRYPKILLAALRAIPQLHIAIVTERSFPFDCDDTLSKRSGRLRLVPPGAVLDPPCHLLVVVEPRPRDRVSKPSHVERIVVLTCQLNFVSSPEVVWTHVVYFHSPDLDAMAEGTQRLLLIQDASVQARDASHARRWKRDAVHVRVLQGRPAGKGVGDETSLERDTYVVVDLSPHAASSPLDMLTAFWDAFDHMLRNVDRVAGWLVCFPPKDGRLAFEQFTQNCLDRLFCIRIDHGNVTTLSRLLSLVPFYRSGSVDRPFDVPVSYFEGLPYVTADTAEEACRAATQYDLEHWSQTVYHVRHM